MTDPNRHNVTVLSPPGFIKVRPSNGHILINTTDYPDHVYKLFYQPTKLRVKTLRRDTLNFINATKGKFDVTVRPYIFQSFNREYNVSLMRVAGKNVDLSLGKGLGRYVGYKLVVHNYFGSSLLETIGLGIPSICFLDRDVYCFEARVS